MSQTKIEQELEQLIKKYEEQNPDQAVWVNGNEYTLVQKDSDGVSYFPITTCKKMAALKSLRRMVK